MSNEVISERQGIILLILFILGSSLLLGASGQANQDAWISIIISILWSIIILLMYSRILSSYPGKDLFDILEIVMGKFIGKIISILMIWYAFHLGTLVTRNLSEFTSNLVFNNTPVVVPMLFFVILLIWGLKEGIEVIGRWSEFFIWVVLLIFIFIVLLAIPQMAINNIKPIANMGFTPILEGAFSSFSFPFGETVVFTMVFSNISKTKNYNKMFMMGLGLGGFIILVAHIRNILVLGSETLSRSYFPSTMAISIIHIGELFQRLEMTVTITLIVCSYIKVIICLFAVCNGISKILGFNDYRFISTPVTLLMFSFSFIIYQNTMEMSNFASDIWPYYSLPFQLIIPLVIFIMVEIRSRRSKTKMLTK
jgi:spore germination protein KB